MTGLMPDSRLNEAERILQHLFRKLFAFNGLLAGAFVLAAYVPMRALPDRKKQPVVTLPLIVQPISLPPAEAPLHLVGAWVLEANDPRFGGLSALALDRGGFLSVSDRGAVVRFDLPSASDPRVTIRDLRVGPGRFGKKWRRDAESLARDPFGRGWWIGYEQKHSLWLYDDEFRRSAAHVALTNTGWSDNRGAEGLLSGPNSLLVTAENGRDVIEFGASGIKRSNLDAGAEVADAARAPDGSAWLLLRSKDLHGISQSIVPLVIDDRGYRVGFSWPLPKEPLDNFEGMTIAQRPEGGWRFWLVTDDGHRLKTRNVLVALDYMPPTPEKDRVTSPSLQRNPAEKQP